jgi:hypothetical protein
MITRIGVDWFQNEGEAKQYFIFYVKDGETKLDERTFTEKTDAIMCAIVILGIAPLSYDDIIVRKG